MIKNTLILVILISYETLFSQDLNCIDAELYNVYNDVEESRDSINSENELSQIPLKTDSLQLIVLPNAYIEFPKWSRYKKNGIDYGFKVLLINDTPDDISLTNIDGRIIMQRQVFYENEWKDLVQFNKTKIAYCGNSLFVKRVINYYDHITFITPCIEGSTKATFRFVIYKGLNRNIELIHSNEFEGYLNPILITETGN